MFIRWILLVYILQIHLKAVTSQRHFRHYNRPASRQYDDEEEPEYNKRSVDFNEQYHSYQCSCSCKDCFMEVKECCKDFCKSNKRYCSGDDVYYDYEHGYYFATIAPFTTFPRHPHHPHIDNDDHYDYPHRDDNYQYPEAIPNPNPEQKVVFVPYPYPLIVPNSENEKSNIQQKIEMTTTEKQTTTTATTTTTKTTKSTKATTTRTKASTAVVDTSLEDDLRAKSLEVSKLSRHRKMKQLNPAVKRNKPAWVPKYGIVPIPDHLAAKLMTQLTEVRALKARKL